MVKKGKSSRNQPSKKDDSAEQYYNRGVTLLQQGDLISAEIAFRQTISINPDYAQAYNYLAFIAQQQSKMSWADIADLLSKAIKAKPDYIEAYYNLAIVLAKQGLWREANKAYLEVIKLQPDCLEAHYNLGVNYTKLGLLSQAQQCFTEAIKLKPDYAQAYYNLGLIFKQLGLLTEAKKALEQTIKIKPDYSQAYNNLGVVYQQSGLFSEAKAAFIKAIAFQPDYFQAYNNLAVILSEIGELTGAANICDQALALNPNLASTYNILGVIFTKQGNLSAAKISCEKAIAIQTDYKEAYNNLGFILSEQGNHQEAIACYEKAIALKPDYAEAYNNLAASLKQQKRYEEARRLCQEAIKIDPNYVQAYNNLGVCYKEENLPTQAIQAYEQAIKINSNYPEAYNNLAVALGEQGLTQEATKAIKQAIALKPDYAEAYCNLGVILAENWSLDEAIAAFRQTLAINPDHGKGHYNLGSILLLNGELKEGFKEYEWRWLGCETPFPEFNQPVWDGSNLEGKTILLVSEQGLGDTLQFIRYAPLVRDLGATVKLACPQLLVSLLKNVEGIASVIPILEANDCEFDCYIPLLSLPYRLGTTLETIPAKMPYISVGEGVSPPLQLPLDKKGKKIGIVWASGYRSNDLGLYNTYQKKSCDLALFLQLLDIPDVILYSLQVGKDAKELEAYLPNPRIVNLAPQIQDFTDTANWVKELDLVISVDTSVAHLAGALNKPVWVLLPYFCDWRWLKSRTDTPWYPRMRLFRQTTPGDWQSILDEIIVELAPPQLSLKNGENQESQGALITPENEEPQLQPEEYYYYLGVSLNQQGLFAEADRAYRQAIAVKPDWAKPYHNLGVVLTKQGLYAEADQAYRQAIALKPDWAECYYNLGITLQKRGLVSEAETVYRQGISINPDFPRNYNNLGAILSKKGLLSEASELFNQAIALKPDYVEAYSNLGYIMAKKRLLATAEQIYHHCINFNKSDPELYFSLGVVLQDMMLLKPAEMAYRDCLALKPDHASAHYNLAAVLMLQGNFLPGLAEYEWRWRSHHLPLPTIAKPRWDGSNLEGKTILLVSEQGLGDTLQFVRYAPVLAKLGALVKLSCPENLARLLSRVAGIREIIPYTETIDCECDCYVPLMSLPHLLQTTMTTIPREIPYINVEAIPPQTLLNQGGMKIGIVWASGMRTSDPGLFGLYSEKSASLELFSQLLNTPTVTLYSLQVGKDAKEIEAYQDNPRIVDLSPRILDFNDTAIFINQMDLVISVDTSVAHLAGAMGKPVWVLLPYSPDWRWLLGRNDTPWYPTMRLFRQTTPGDWEGVFEQVLINLSFVINVA